ncbi:nuclear transport factor 2 family protein [Rhodococcus sp. BP-349]|uniref:nuclear transport factor 2 family protein n=1 Tax=unclassified Rhodococcus (in: high G+C Gram-positive bacteria) TaxID=192944 RepID=UPI001C9A434E|nr:MULTISPECIES: nuclear transport factor 2 family protein [unclassified Rhodococcus (in: high G+C Gram-positive bacteria)]MBY6537705.1 nuclear transport factor 2 family protein [Rhodococcus sp. BP-363]MBY6542042.1 nuclear transport factor 2 family protein [Rhodococcus sp. BP-369]MBY6561272.1 nuclear transport factor 2 family protein [Rhodococcus sp. BP-370]MBY6575564.1 nuclear transport factor 2 family protein [Rhodococcus sp. BP-364]MBY6584865.1 nuclear transport factor 2 family protein [Rho
MSENALETIFRTQMAAYADCDVEALIATFTDDCVLVDMADVDHPFVGTDAVRGFLVDYFAALRHVVVDVTMVATGTDSVIGELDVTANYVGAPFTEQTPRPIRLRYCVAEEIRDGGVSSERFYWDSADLERQLTVV